MHYITKMAVILAAAAAMSIVISPLYTAVFRDALLDFLDEQTVNSVTNYLSRTQVSRSFGIFLLLITWTVFVIGIDRLVDMATRKQARANRL
jgi:hypothetical protein